LIDFFTAKLVKEFGKTNQLVCFLRKSLPSFDILINLIIKSLIIRDWYLQCWYENRFYGFI